MSADARTDRDLHGALSRRRLLEATSTGFGMLALAGLTARPSLAGVRRAVEREHGAQVRGAQARFGGILSPVFLGYRLLLDDGWVHWRGGLFGPVTAWRLGTRRGKHDGWADADTLARDFFPPEHERPEHEVVPEALDAANPSDQ